MSYYFIVLGEVVKQTKKKTVLGFWLLLTEFYQVLPERDKIRKEFDEKQK